MSGSMQPQSHKDIIFANAAAAQLVDDIVNDRLPFPANGKNGLLIYGPNGTGKSTLASLLPDAIEMVRTGRLACVPTRHAITSGNNGAALISSLARVAANVALSFSYQFFILDEVDNLGAASMNSLKSVMDMPMTVFIMTTNNLSAIERGVLSRSHLIDMTTPPPSAWLARCRAVLATNGVTAQPSDDVLLPLIASCNGDAREILTEMHKLALAMV